MTDLEITRLCAEAMGFTEYHHATDKLAWTSYNEVVGDYDPLHDDAQAMALVKRFPMDIHGTMENSVSRSCWHAKVLGSYPEGKGESVNRAICECVAKMRLTESKNREPSPDFDTQGG